MSKWYNIPFIKTAGFFGEIAFCNQETGKYSKLFRRAIPWSVILGVLLFVITFSLYSLSYKFFGYRYVLPVVNPFSVISVVLISPVVETLLLQALPFMIGRYLNFDNKIIIIISVLVFALVHSSNGLQPLIINGFVSGIYLACCYSIFSRMNIAIAIVTTTIVHAVHNSIVVYSLKIL